MPNDALFRTLPAARWTPGLPSPALSNLANGFPQTRALGEQEQDPAAQRRRRTDQELAAGVAFGASSLPQITLQSERRMDPSSKAFQRQESRTAGREQIAAAQDSFRQNLRDAASREQIADRAAQFSDATAASTDTHASFDDSSETRSGPRPGNSVVPRGAGDARSSSASSASALPAASPPTLSASRSDAAVVAPNPIQADSTAAAASASAAVGSNPPPQLSAASTPSATPEAVSAISTIAASNSATTASGASSNGSAGAARPILAAAANPSAARDFSAPASQSAKAPPQPPTSNNDAQVEQLVRVIASRIGRDRSTATIRLDPPLLGMVRLHMDLRNERLFLRVESGDAARRLLTERVDALRQALEAAGIQLDRVEFRTVEPITPDQPQPESKAQPGTADAQHGDRDFGNSQGGGAASNGRDSIATDFDDAADDLFDKAAGASQRDSVSAIFGPGTLNVLA